MQTSRRDFLRAVGTVLAAHQVSEAFARQAPLPVGAEPSVQAVIDAILAEVPGQAVADTVDTVKIGDPQQKLNGIATTFLPTCEVIDKTRAAGANLLVTHEPIFYNHRDEVDWLADDSIYTYKRKLLEEARIVVWRFHDYWHRVRPDPVTAALLEDIGLGEAETGDENYLCTIAPTPLARLAKSFKERLGLPMVRVIGDLERPCRRIGVLPGAWGGRMQIGVLARERPDLLVCGEINEWETSIYVQDAIWAGQTTALIILGHVNTEEPGMRALADWLRIRLPGVPVRHVPMGEQFRYL